MAVNAAPSGKAPPGRLRFGVGAMALVTAFPVAARGPHADKSAGPGDAAWVDTWAHLAYGCRTTQTTEKGLI
jgi:hypothetical protein